MSEAKIGTWRDWKEYSRRVLDFDELIQVAYAPPDNEYYHNDDFLEQLGRCRGQIEKIEVEEGGDFDCKIFGRWSFHGCEWDEFCRFYYKYNFIDYVRVYFQSGEEIIMNYTCDKAKTALAFLLSKNHDIELVPFLEEQERLSSPADSEPQKPLASSMIKYFKELGNAYRDSAAKKKKELRMPEKSHLKIIGEYKNYNRSDEEFIKLVIELDLNIEASDIETLADALPACYGYDGFCIASCEYDVKNVSLYSLSACRSYCHSHGMPDGTDSFSFNVKGKDIVNTSVWFDIGGNRVELFYKSDGTDRNKLLELIDSVMEYVYEDKVNNEN